VWFNSSSLHRLEDNLGWLDSHLLSDWYNFSDRMNYSLGPLTVIFLRTLLLVSKFHDIILLTIIIRILVWELYLSNKFSTDISDLGAFFDKKAFLKIG